MYVQHNILFASV